MPHDGTDVTLLTCGEVTYVIVRPKALTVKISPYLALKHGEFISSLQTRKKLFHVHSAFEKRVRTLSKVDGRSNPRDGIRNHRRPPSDPVFVIHRSGDNEHQNAGYDHLRLLP